MLVRWNTTKWSAIWNRTQRTRRDATRRIIVKGSVLFCHCDAFTRFKISLKARLKTHARCATLWVQQRVLREQLLN